MNVTGVTRLVISAYPIADDRPRLPIWILRRVLATPHADAAQMEQIIPASGLAWTIARLNRLTSKPATRAIATSTSLLPRPRALTRAAATTLLDLAENPALARTPVNITGTEHVPLVIRRLPRHARKYVVIACHGMIV